MNLDKAWNETKEKLKHNSILDVSKMHLWQSTIGISTDDDFEATISKLYAKGERSAVVLIYNEGEISGFVANESVITKIFDQSFIHDAIRTYKPIISICVILVMGPIITIGEVDPDEFYEWL